MGATLLPCLANSSMAGELRRQEGRVGRVGGARACVPERARGGRPE